MSIEYPTAHDLDSGSWGETSGWSCKLYLVPGAETDSGVPRVAIHYGLGNIGWPMPAHHGRWVAIGSYGPQVVGQSVLDALVRAEEQLLDLSAAYEGTEWDGNNYRGQWAVEPEELFDSDVLRDVELKRYWKADDWFGNAGIDWEELCAEAAVWHKLALRHNWEDVVEQVAEALDGTQDEPVSGIAAYARRMAEQYREERLVDGEQPEVWG